LNERIAIIPARSGSKRIPGKNSKDFLGTPMIEWPLRALKSTGLFDHVIVSTDDPQVAAISRPYGIEVLGRALHLADDFTDTTTVLKAIISDMSESHEDPWVYMIYPTTPTTGEILEEFVSFCEAMPSGFSVSVAKSRVPVQRAMAINEQGVLSLREPDSVLTRSQDLKPVFFDAGKFYGARKSDWVATSNPLCESPRGFEIPDWLSIDLDTLEDWEFAEYKFRGRAVAN
jgi:pseudaminic acid cytidylyltransferase